jgi:hypothetical protein
MLIFDNGPHRLDHSFPFSRVIEVNPATKEIVLINGCQMATR